MTSRPEFRQWLDRQADPKWGLMPLTHICKSFIANDIMREGRIEPSHCDVFERSLTYFFYGRPAYRTKGDRPILNPAACPMCFIFDPQIIDLGQDIHPFDTGAFNARLYSHIILDEMSIDDFSLERDISRPNKLIHALYGNRETYFEGEKSNISNAAIPSSEFLVRTYIDLLKSVGRNEPDDRVGTIEVIFGNPVPLDGNLIAIVTPDVLWNDHEKSDWLSKLAEVGVDVLPFRYNHSRPPRTSPRNDRGRSSKLFQRPRRHMSRSRKRFRIIGAIRLCPFNPSFGLAVAASEDAPGFWLQVIEPGSQRISEFTPLSQDEWADIHTLESIPIEVGDEYIHAFINKLGELHLDTASALKTTFRVALNDIDTSSAVKLTISENMGNTSDAYERRKALMESMSTSFGPDAARSFEISAARTKLWDILEAAAAHPDALARIRKILPQLLVDIGPSGTLTIDISALAPTDLTLSPEQILDWLAGTFGRHRGDWPMPRADLTGLPDSAEPTMLTILEAARRSPRQEERLAILIRALILHPKPALAALRRYSDPAQMARNAIEALKPIASRLPPEATETERDIVFAQAISKIISDAYPRRRGTILFYFAEHLSDFPHISARLQNILAKSRSMEVEVLRAHIERALAGRALP